MQYILISALLWYVVYLNHVRGNTAYVAIGSIGAIFSSFLSLLYVLNLLGVI